LPKRKANQPELLKGWKEIAKFLGLTPATVQRWARGGMPVRREGRYTVADGLEQWIGRESQMPKAAHVLTGDADISVGGTTHTGRAEISAQ
jgi:phage terminase Nu1 subunit (DNA packaging protein)